MNQHHWAYVTISLALGPGIQNMYPLQFLCMLKKVVCSDRSCIRRIRKIEK